MSLQAATGAELFDMGEPTIGLKTYEKVFELLLRLKANYIWPAVHVNFFNLTPESGALADRMGIVVGTPLAGNSG